MSSSKKTHLPDDETPPEKIVAEKAPEAAEAPDGEAAPAISPQEVEALKKDLEQARAQAEEYKDGWQRSVAEFSNYRKRLERENSEVYQNAVANIVKHYLPIVDDLERALSARPADLAWAEGIDLIYRKLQSILEAEGIKRIDAVGQPFDPNFHEAISQDPSAEHASGQVIEVIRNGYMLGERVIRPAMVRVAQ